MDQMTSSSFNSEDHLHCINCHITTCDYDQCLLIPCKLCFARLHVCKLDDHLLICSKAHVGCINASYGCTSTVRRERMAIHLASCPANAVYCNYHWYRKYVSVAAEREFKSLAKSLTANLPATSSAEMDTNLVLQDQNTWFRFLRNRRLKRIRNASQIDENVYDTSDEEQLLKEKYERNNPFSGCHLCRLHPGSQHLHVLGNLSPIKWLRKKEKNTLENSKFNEMRGLYMELDHFCVDDSKSLIRTHCLNRCTRVFRRDQAADHAIYHVRVQSAIPGFIVQRCPMSSKGCGFSTTGLTPRIGQMRFNDFLGFVVHVSTADAGDEPSVTTFHRDCTDYFIVMMHVLGDYLDGASIVCLAATNARIRRRIYASLANRLVVELVWRRQSDGKWIVDATRRFFGAVQRPTEWTVQPLASLSEHISKCPLNVMKSFQGIDKVELPWRIMSSQE